MSPQDIDRTIEFILQTQARTASQMQIFQEEMRGFHQQLRGFHQQLSGFHQELRGFHEELRGFHEEFRDQKASISGLVEISRNSIEHNQRMDEIVHSVTQILALQSVRIDRLEGRH